MWSRQTGNKLGAADRGGLGYKGPSAVFFLIRAKNLRRFAPTTNFHSAAGIAPVPNSGLCRKDQANENKYNRGK